MRSHEKGDMRGDSGQDSSFIKEHRNQQVFKLEYEKGLIYDFQNSKERVKGDIWAYDHFTAAERAILHMRAEESLYTVVNRDTCRLDIYPGNQNAPHIAIWVNPYGVAPSQLLNARSDENAINSLQQALDELKSQNSPQQQGDAPQ